jgi:hypothetical protein
MPFSGLPALNAVKLNQNAYASIGHKAIAVPDLTYLRPLRLQTGCVLLSLLAQPR